MGSSPDPTISPTRDDSNQSPTPSSDIASGHDEVVQTNGQGDFLLYKYEPLPTPSSFRILELLAGNEEDKISYRLHFADWNAPPFYEAISYAWGETTIKVSTICHGRSLTMTPNLEDGLRQMRFQNRSRWLWADAVCIDQTNVRERGHQVDHMSQIYRKATRVLVWLGGDEEKHAEQAIEAIAEIGNACVERNEISIKQLREIDDFYHIATKPLPDKLHCNNDETWLSLAWFFSRPWFSRLWVFQEVNSGPEVEMMCGQYSVNWQLVALTATYIRTHMPIGRRREFLEVNIERTYFMRHRRFHSSMDLPTILHQTREFLTSNPLDKVYAMLAMPQLASMNPAWKAEYSKSKGELYIQVATRCIIELKSLSVLAFVQHTTEIDDTIPSWAPQWDQMTILTPIGNRAVYRWTAGGIGAISAEIDAQACTLRVSGLDFDVVESERHIDVFQWFNSEVSVPQDHPLLGVWRSWTTQNSPYSTDQSVKDACSSVFSAGEYVRGPPHTFDSIADCRADFLAYIEHLLKLSGQSLNMTNEAREEAVQGDWSSYETRAGGRCWNRSFFTTKKGYKGLGPSALREGDAVCVLFGAEVPYILRPKHDYFQLVGDAYVHGIYGR